MASSVLPLCQGRASGATLLMLRSGAFDELDVRPSLQPEASVKQGRPALIPPCLLGVLCIQAAWELEFSQYEIIQAEEPSQNQNPGIHCPETLPSQRTCPPQGSSHQNMTQGSSVQTVRGGGAWKSHPMLSV